MLHIPRLHSILACQVNGKVPRKYWVLCSHEIMPEQSSSGPESFAFPELPGAVRSLACMPLEAVLQVPAGASSVPGPLEESLLRCSVHTMFTLRTDP